MWRKAVASVSVCVVAVACSSGDDSKGGCEDISGNWQVTSTQTSGTCPDSGGGPSSVTMRRDGDEWIVVMPAVSGGCPGTLDSKTCRFVSNCDVTKSGQLVGSFGLDWTFSGGTLSGSEIGRLLPPAVPRSCESSYTDTGKKL